MTGDPVTESSCTDVLMTKEAPGTKGEGTGAGEQKKTTVLIVDDEIGSLELLHRTLRGFYRVLRACNGSDGLHCLELNAVAVVIADQRMPGLTGVEFLSKSARMYPQTQRILLTGYTEVEGVIDAINEGRVFGYLAKPWHPNDLLTMLKKAEEMYHLLGLKERLLNELRQKNRELERLLAETKELQAAKVQAERWAAIGKLSGMVAHDLRNPLAAIQCHTGLLREGVFSEKLLERSTRSILNQVQKMSHYIEDLLLFAKPVNPHSYRRPYAIPALIASLQEAFSERCRRRNIALEIRGEFTGSCYVNPSQVYRVLSNILDNAVEAAGRDGRIRVTTEAMDAGEIRVRVEDSGPGISPEIRQNLFEPFVTHNKASGTGIGLAVVKKIIQEHGGRVWEEKGGLGGACFCLVLPQDFCEKGSEEPEQEKACRPRPVPDHPGA